MGERVGECGCVCVRVWVSVCVSVGEHVSEGVRASLSEQSIQQKREN